MASVLVHVALVIALLTFRFPQEIPAPVLGVRAVTLLTPIPPPVRVVMLVPVEIPRERPRRFQAPALAATAVPYRELVSAPVIDIPRPLLVSPELRPIATLPAPPLRTENLTSPLAVVPVAAPVATVRAAGFACATAGSQRDTGTLRRAGFESVLTADAAAPPRLLAHAGFGDVMVTAGPGPGPATAASVSAVTRPVEILSRPKPVYSEEARGRRIEGEVLLQVLFAASGQVRVLTTVRGLGYGLDENALAAAEAIRFRPAERAGVAADSTAVVHIVFQLAY